MRDLFTGARRLATRTAPSTLAAAAAAFSLGAYSGHAATLSAHRAARHTFTLVLRAKTVTINPGSTRRLKLVVRRRHLRARVTFKLISKLPRGTSVRFSPRRTRGRSTILILRVSRSARPGRYRLRLRARAGHVRRTVTLTLNVVRRKAATPSRAAGTPQTAGPPQLSISGSVGAPLEPGQPQPIDVVITNPNDSPLTLTSLSVSVQSITAPQASSSLPCTSADFTVQPYSGQQPLTVPASSAVTLSELGVPSSQWPEVGLLDRPTNQDGCQGAALSLTYSADARLG